MHFPWVRIVALCSVLGAPTANASETGGVTGEFCSVVPYPIEVVVTTEGGSEGDFISQTHLIEPGQCAVVHRATDFFYYARAIDSEQLLYLQFSPEPEYHFFSQSWGGYPNWTGDALPVCVEETTFAFRRVKLSGECGYKEAEISMARMGRKGVDRQVEHIADPHICDSVLSFSCNNLAIADARVWAEELGQSISLAYGTISPRRATYGLAPAAAGFEVSNTSSGNGPFDKGLVVTEALQVNALGAPVAVDVGDIILTINGHPLFDRNALVDRLAEHGASLGYGEPAILLISRSGSTYEVGVYLSFKYDTWGRFFLNEDGSCRAVTTAALRSALEEASFYLHPYLACFGLADDASLVLDDGCVFQVQQLVAAYRQFCPNENWFGALIGSLYLPGRNLAERAIQKYVITSRWVAAGILRNVVLEVIEDVARTTISLPPGLSSEDSLSTLENSARTSAGLSIAFSVLLPKGYSGVLK